MSKKYEKNVMGYKFRRPEIVWAHEDGEHSQFHCYNRMSWEEAMAWYFEALSDMDYELARTIAEGVKAGFFEGVTR